MEYEISRFLSMESLLFPQFVKKLVFKMNPEHIHILNKFLGCENNVQKGMCRKILERHFKVDIFNVEVVLSYSWIKNLKHTFQISLLRLLPQRKMNIITRIVRATEKIEYNILNANGLVFSEWKDKDDLDSLIAGAAKIGEKIFPSEN